MNFRLVAGLAIVLAASQVVAQDKAGKKPEGKSAQLKTLTDKVSYSIGLDIGGNLKAQGIEVEPAALLQGIKDALANAKPALSKDELMQVMKEFEEVRAEKSKNEGEKNMKQGTAFLAANKKKEGVKTTPSGLQYKIIKAGQGKKPVKTDFVKTNYRGTLVDGREFDSSEKHGGPAVLQVRGVIPGWQEALQMMPVGSKWQLYIPADLAYADESRGEMIGPGSTLIFDLELLSIEKNPPPRGPATEEEDSEEDSEELK